MKFPKPLTLAELAMISSSILPDSSHAGVVITGVNTADSAEEGDIIWVESREAQQALVHSPAAAVLTPVNFPDCQKPSLQHPCPKLAFGKILGLLIPRDEGDPSTAWIHPEACVDSRAVICGKVRIGRGTRIQAGAVIGYGVEIGEDCTIGYNVVLNWGTKIGNRVLIHSCSVLGTDGFGYVQQPSAEDPSMFESLKIPHAGIVIIEDDVEIGANVCIDRGLIQPTVIGHGTKIDNLVQIGHNCQIGPNNILIGQAGFSGSITTGKNVVVYGQVGISDHTHIGDHAILLAATKVAGKVPAKSKLMGFPPMPKKDFWQYITSIMDITLVRKIIAAACEAENYDDFKQKVGSLKIPECPARKLLE